MKNIFTISNAPVYRKPEDSPLTSLDLKRRRMAIDTTIDPAEFRWTFDVDSKTIEALKDLKYITHIKERTLSAIEENYLQRKRFQTPGYCHYCYPGTETLKNLYGIRDLLEFDERLTHETVKTIINFHKIEPLPERFDLDHLKYIHQRLFANVFEWAGCTREEPFTFLDGTTAYLPIMRKVNSSLYFVPSDEIRSHFSVVDDLLTRTNNFKDSSHEEFVAGISKVFSSTNKIHPFREGNGRTKRIFCEKLAKAAGRKLDFSLVTKAQIDFASTQAMEYNNLEPLKHMFEDISNPDKRAVLRECREHMKSLDVDIADSDYYPVAAEEGKTYRGYHEATYSNSLAIKTHNGVVICEKNKLAPKFSRTLKYNDFVSFTYQKSNNILIPKEELPPLTPERISKAVFKNLHFQESLNRVRKYSAIVYGDPKILDDKIRLINLCPVEKRQNLGELISKQIAYSPQSIAKLAGKKYFFIKNSTHIKAENLLILSVHKYLCMPTLLSILQKISFKIIKMSKNASNVISKNQMNACKSSCIHQQNNKGGFCFSHLN
ncbi:BID domain-containing T4SS effector [Bartonella ancashensis]|uniref:protein adenylyltransferase n=1 Tax=Bartonella ancashensis TaxID=1318743 RepID=A0A0M4LIR9_9HYPH|nr:BID domain-containing T4SS effector [Bartonella ancashensis]ALE03014.1 hypothetical protein PU02_0200 [Bartonella ancashensis]ARE31019.1 Bep200 [Bartonella ancashensis]